MGYLSGVPVVKILGLFTAGFFVFLGASKANSKALKSFGNILATALCVAAVSLLVLKVYLKATGQSPWCKWDRFKKSGINRMMRMDRMQMDNMPQPMPMEK
jgi:hypothetical protein